MLVARPPFGVGSVHARGVSDPNWYPDPMGRYELRYYDGAQWTAHVSTGGVTSSDPLPDQQGPASTPSAAGFDPSAQAAPQQFGVEQSGAGLYPPQETWQTPQASSGSNKGVIGLLAAIGAVIVLFGIGAFLVFGGDDGDGDVEAVAGSDGDETEDDIEDAGSTTTEADSTTLAPTVTGSSTTEESTDTTGDTPPLGGVPAPDDPATAIPEYGSDPVFDALADGCQAGLMQSCDDLFFESEIDSGYEAYGDSCGGRNVPAGYCTTLYPAAS